jgi:hypothetical protein
MGFVACFCDVICCWQDPNPSEAGAGKGAGHGAAEGRFAKFFSHPVSEPQPPASGMLPQALATVFFHMVLCTSIWLSASYNYGESGLCDDSRSCFVNLVETKEMFAKCQVALV